MLLNSGPKVVEPNCGSNSKIENIFMSGNERTLGGFALPDAVIKSGYSLTPQDSFILTTQLMNMEDKEKWVSNEGITCLRNKSLKIGRFG